MTSIAGSHIGTSPSAAGVGWQTPTQGSNPSQLGTNENTDDSKSSLKPKLEASGDEFWIPDQDFADAEETQEGHDILESLYGGIEGVKKFTGKTEGEITHSVLEQVFNAKHENVESAFCEEMLESIVEAKYDLELKSNLWRSACMTLTKRQNDERMKELLRQQDREREDQAAASG